MSVRLPGSRPWAVLLLVGLLMVVCACAGGEPAPTTAGTIPTTATSATTTTHTAGTAATTTTSGVTTTTTPPPPPSVELAAGLYCGEVKAAGYGFQQAMAYWVREGRPDKMDADHNGIPCQTVYTTEEVEEVLWFEQDDGLDPLPSGLLCRDVASWGYGFGDALAYWVREGAPDRMDADRNGLPCETVFPDGEILAVMAFDGSPRSAWVVASGLDAGWQLSSAEFPASPGCCGENATAPQSPVLPEPGQPLQDGVYPIDLSGNGGDPRVMDMDVKRWMPCSSQPDRCNAPFGEDDAFVDDSTAVHITLAVDQSLTVVVQGIRDMASPGEGDQIIGDGSSFVRLVEHASAACRWEADQDPGEVEGITFVDGAGWLCQGPAGVYLAPHGWWATLEIKDSSPLLWVLWNQIAG